MQGPPDANIRPEVRELKFVVDSKILDGVREAKEVFKQNVSDSQRLLSVELSKYFVYFWYVPRYVLVK